jgi:hypothetical protein
LIDVSEKDVAYNFRVLEAKKETTVLLATLHSGFLLGLFFHTVDGGDVFL